jgi:hypothetical protein
MLHCGYSSDYPDRLPRSQAQIRPTFSFPRYRCTTAFPANTKPTQNITSASPTIKPAAIAFWLTDNGRNGKTGNSNQGMNEPIANPTPNFAIQVSGKGSLDMASQSIQSLTAYHCSRILRPDRS